MNQLVSGLARMHTGELLREDILPALNKPKAEIARLIEVSRQTLYDILAEKQDVTPTMALRIGKLTGRSEEHTAEPQSLMSISYAVFCLIENENRPLPNSE